MSGREASWWTCGARRSSGASGCTCPSTPAKARSGAVTFPGAKSIPWARAIDPDTHTFRTADELRNAVREGEPAAARCRDDRLLPHRRAVVPHLVRADLPARLRRGAQLRRVVDRVGQWSAAPGGEAVDGPVDHSRHVHRRSPPGVRPGPPGRSPCQHRSGGGVRPLVYRGARGKGAGAERHDAGDRHAGTARPRSGSSCSRATTSAASCSSPTIAARRAPSWSRIPQAALVFFWPELERQVRITGPVSVGVHARSRRRTSGAGRAASRLSTWVSHQSQVIPGRSIAGGTRASRCRPSFPTRCRFLPHWGGYRVTPEIDRVLAGTREPAARSDPLSPREAAAGDWNGCRRDGDAGKR